MVENPVTHEIFRTANATLTDARTLSVLELAEALVAFFSSSSCLRLCQNTTLSFADNPIQRVKAEEGQVRFNVELQVPLIYDASDFDFQFQPKTP